MKVYFITSNKGKVLEAKKKFSEIGIELVQKNIGYPEIQAECLEDVAKYGVENIQSRVDHSFILEDAGIFIDSLNGFPGVYSAYVFYSIGCKGILKLLGEKNNRKACFKSVFAYCMPNEKPKIFSGECNGRISMGELGSNGFGYDPIFIPEGSKKTFAQMKTVEKNNFSHRGKSLEKLLNFFKNK